MHAWPLLITVVPAVFEAGDVEPYILEVEALYRRGERFASLVDTSALSSLPGAAERKRFADWQNSTKDAIKRYNVFTAIVVRSPVMRSALTAMNWVFRPPNEQVAVPSFADAFVRCIDKLRADGHPAPPEFERMARESPPTSAEDTFRGALSARGDRTVSQRRPPGA
jgi:hypothetical protein